MNLHKSTENFKQSILITADIMNIDPVLIEKDYWVTYALNTIFNHEIGKDIVFKGGTSLSKCFGMVERFSEDIDLIVLRKENETDSKLKSKLKAISKRIDLILPEIEIENISKKMGMNRKTAHTYEKIFKGNFGQIRDVIILESTWLGHHEPFTFKAVQSFIGQMMLKNDQAEYAIQYGLMPFEVRVLEPIRTLCEKIMSLVRFSYTQDPIDDLKQKIRHTYDLHQLLQQPEFSNFLASNQFEEMLLKVANDDLIRFKNNNKWLAFHPSEALMFSNLDTVWLELKSIYLNSFSNMVYGELPKESDVFNSLNMIKERLKYIEWNITIA